MKKRQIFFLAVSVLSVFLLIQCELINKDGKCEYNGIRYNIGDSFSDIDNCNTCTCEDDKTVSCTVMHCQKGCEYYGNIYNTGDSFEDIDGCNTCTCVNNGTIGCTEKLCIDDEDGIKITFVNKSTVVLTDLIVKDRAIGELFPDMASQMVIYEEFTFDSGMPDEDASTIVDGNIVSNFDRGYWCGTEKITATEGQYTINIIVYDDALHLTCLNGPTIFD